MAVIGRRTGPRRVPAAVLAALLALLVASTAMVLAATGTKAWIDQPLPGSVAAFGPTPVTVHAASDVGVAAIRFLVDGIPAEEVGAPSGELVTVDWTWLPPSLGLHLLTAVAIGTDGSSSDPVSVAVTFVSADDVPATPPPGPTAIPEPSGAGPSPAPTLPPGATPGPPRPPGATPAPSPGPTAPPSLPPGATPTPAPPTAPPSVAPTPTPTASPRPTPTPCPPLPAIPLLPADGTGVDPGPTLEWTVDFDVAGCVPSGFLVQISSSRTFDTILQQADLPAGQTTWTAGPGLVECETHSWRVASRGADGSLGPFSTPWTFYIRGRICP